MGKLLFNVLSMMAEFEADLIRQRTREGMAVAKARRPSIARCSAPPLEGGTHQHAHYARPAVVLVTFHLIRQSSDPLGEGSTTVLDSDVRACS